MFIITKKRTVKLISILVGFTIIMALFHFCYYPEFSEKFFIKNYDKMMRIVEMARNNELIVVQDKSIRAFDQIYSQVLQVPLSYRTLSHKGLIYFRDNGGEISVLFICGYDLVDSKVYEAYKYSENSYELKSSFSDTYPNWSMVAYGG